MKTFTAWAASIVLICSTLYFPGLSSNFETGTLLKTLKRRAELIGNCAFPYSVLATSTRNGQCSPESRWGGSRFCDVIFFSAIAIKRLFNNEWRRFVFEEFKLWELITNIEIFIRIKAQVLANKPEHFWTVFFPKDVYKNRLKARPLLKCKQHIFLGWYIIGTFEKRAPRIEKSQKIYLKLYTFTEKKHQLLKILG